jgi:low affinity Fe/Cu permease
MKLRPSADVDAPAADRSAGSRALTWLDSLTTKPGAAIAVAAAVVAVWVTDVFAGFDTDLQVAFGTVCSGVTVTMVFVIQHTQRRAQQATQLKLDELIRSLPQADDRVVRVEASSDAELDELEERVAEHHRAQRVDEPHPAP